MKLKETILKVYSKLYNWNDKKVILIISSGRTGTNFMAHWFGSLNESIYAVHEPSPDFFQIGIDKYRNKKSITKNLLKLNRALQLYSINKKNQKVYIESNPNLLLLIPELNTLFKNLKIIFIKRDFSTYFLSAMNKSPDDSYKNFFYDENDPRKRITAIDMDDKLFGQSWTNFSREEKIAWYWKTSNELIDQYNSSNSNSMIINFEDLFEENNQDLIKEILKFTELNHELSSADLARFKVKKNINKVKQVIAMSDLKDELKDKIYSIIN